MQVRSKALDRFPRIQSKSHDERTNPTRSRRLRCFQVFKTTGHNTIKIKMTDQARWKATVYVGGLAPMVTVANLEAAFLPFGEIADVSIP